MAKTELIKSACGFCSAACGVQVTLEDSQAIKIEGDPESPPNRGALCIIGDAALEFLYHPDRLKYPLKRVGERGEGKWQQISWDDALTTTAETFNRIKRESGPEAVFVGHGSAKSFIDTHLVRLANAFGTPNVVTADHICHVPRMVAAEMMVGFFGTPFRGFGVDFPTCILNWGANKQNTRFYTHNYVVQAVKNGTKLVVVDPMETKLARMADLWLQIRPGADLALALAFINIIINEELYDKEFVDQWTVGFDRLRDHVQEYSPEKVAEIAWVSADQITAAAHMYATTRPGFILQGNALDQTINSFDCGRAMAILTAITGNIGVPGGEREDDSSGFRYGDLGTSGSGLHARWSEGLELRYNIPREAQNRKIGAELIHLPDFRYIVPQALVRSILEGVPYRTRGGYIQATNPLSTWTNVKEVHRAFKEIEFLAVADFFMSATAAMADIVFPSATWLEFDGIQLPSNGTLAQAQRKVAQIGQCRSDHEIINGLAHKMGLGEYFWERIEDFWDYVVSPTKMTFQEFKEKGRFAGTYQLEVKKYEREGFRTPSGKVEIYSSELEKLGLHPLPTYQEPTETPFSAPELAREYPLVFTYMKLAPYRQSCGKQIPRLRNSHPEPLTTIHPDTAEALGIKNGDWIYIETKRGRIRQKAKVSASVDQRVIYIDPCWWYPERGNEDMGHWAESNSNVLTNDGPPYNPAVGSLNMRGILCKIYKAS